MNISYGVHDIADTYIDVQAIYWYTILQELKCVVWDYHAGKLVWGYHTSKLVKVGLK
jgi:hypothetical protein